ncbi:MAG: histidine kinase, partial [bacterium]|nr:histidine kinase [bacterium]
VFVLDDRVEVHSPGGLPNSVTVERVKAGLAHVLRNPNIYTFFRRAGLVTDTGNGVRRAMRLVKEAVGIEPAFYEQGAESREKEG